MITGLIFRQQNQMIARAVFVIETVLCHIYFTPDDGLDAGIFGRFIKLNHTEHVAVIRYGDGIHALFAHGIHQPINAAKTVQQTKLCMQMEVCKRHSALLSEFNAFLLPERVSFIRLLRHLLPKRAIFLQYRHVWQYPQENLPVSDRG